MPENTRVRRGYKLGKMTEKPIPWTIMLYFPPTQDLTKAAGQIKQDEMCGRIKAPKMSSS